MASKAESGENSEDECCLCGRLWDQTCTGWPLCDTPSCPNTVCKDCAKALIVTEFFYCPPCGGSGIYAAASAGPAVTSLVQVCFELETLPLSMKAMKTICRNLLKKEDNPKYRTLRLANPKVKELLDLDPCRRLLTFIGFVEKKNDNAEISLVKEGSIDKGHIIQIYDILESLSCKHGDEEKQGPEKATKNPSKKRDPPQKNTTESTHIQNQKRRKPE